MWSKVCISYQLLSAFWQALRVEHKLTVIIMLLFRLQVADGINRWSTSSDHLWAGSDQVTIWSLDRAVSSDGNMTHWSYRDHCIITCENVWTWQRKCYWSSCNCGQDCHVSINSLDLPALQPITMSWQLCVLIINQHFNCNLHRQLTLFVNK